MTEDFSEDILFRVVAQMCKMVGFQSVLSSPLYILTDILRQLILYLGKRARSYCELCGRTNVELSDLSRTFTDLRIYPSELVDFFQTVRPLPLPISVPRYPVALNKIDQEMTKEYNTVACVDFKSEKQVGFSVNDTHFLPQNHELEYSNCIEELNKSTGFNQSSLQENNEVDCFPNFTEARESLKVTISIAGIKKAHKKKVSKKQKKKVDKARYKKKKKKKNKHSDHINLKALKLKHLKTTEHVFRKNKFKTT